MTNVVASGTTNAGSQGAGVASALSVRTGSDFDRVDMAPVQAELERQGVRIY